MSKQTPLQIIKQQHTSKAGLVDHLAGKLERPEGESAEDFKARLLRVSNQKLIRLEATFKRYEGAFSSKAALVDAVIAAKSPRQAKDADYKAKLTTWPITKLMDMYESARRKSA